MNTHQANAIQSRIAAAKPLLTPGLTLGSNYAGGAVYQDDAGVFAVATRYVGAELGNNGVEVVQAYRDISAEAFDSLPTRGNVVTVLAIRAAAGVVEASAFDRA